MSSGIDEEYTVEAIRGWRYNLSRAQREFFIKWQNYPEQENTWEPLDNLNCPDVLERFINNLPPKELSDFRTKHPDRLHGFDRHSELLQTVGADGPHDSDSEDTDKDDKQKFYCLLAFADSDMAEESTLLEFFNYRPEEALAFCEERLLYKKKPKH